MIMNPEQSYLYEQYRKIGKAINEMVAFITARFTTVIYLWADRAV